MIWTSSFPPCSSRVVSTLGPSAQVAVSASQEAYNDALYFKDEALRAFKLGILSLEERAQVFCLHRMRSSCLTALL